MIRNPKTKRTTQVILQVYTLEILQQLKNPLLLMEGLVLALTFLRQNVQLSCSSRTLEEILGAHPMNNDDFRGGTNPSDMSIDTSNSKEMIAGHRITHIHTNTKNQFT